MSLSHSKLELITARLHYLSREFSSLNSTLDGVFAAICTQIEMSFIIIAAIIPCLRPFMRTISTNYSAAQARNPAGIARSLGDQHSMRSQGSRQHMIRKDVVWTAEVGNRQPDFIQYPQVDMVRRHLMVACTFRRPSDGVVHFSMEKLYNTYFLCSQNF